MDSLLLLLLSADNKQRATAEHEFELRKAQSPRDVLSQLCHIVASPAANEGVRSLAAVLLRGITVREAKLWASLSDEEVRSVRDMLLGCLTQTDGAVGHLQRKVAHVAAAHAKLAPFPALHSAVVQLSASADPRHNELSLFLVDKLAEYTPKEIVADVATVGRIIEPFLTGQRGDLSTRASACKALCSVAYELPHTADGAAKPVPGNDGGAAAAVAALCGALAHIPPFLHAALAAGDEQLLQDVLTSTKQLSEDRRGLLRAIHAPLAAALASVCHAPADAVDGATKVLALGVLVDMHMAGPAASEPAAAESRKSCLLLCMHHMADVDVDDDAVASPTRPAADDGFGDVSDGGGGDGDLAECAAQCLHDLAGALDSREVVHVCLQTAWGLVGKDDWRGRRAALLTASLICDGASDAMRPLVPQLVPAVVKCLSDPHPRVRPFVTLPFI